MTDVVLHSLYCIIGKIGSPQSQIGSGLSSLIPQSPIPCSMPKWITPSPVVTSSSHLASHKLSAGLMAMSHQGIPASCLSTNFLMGGNHTNGGHHHNSYLPHVDSKANISPQIFWVAILAIVVIASVNIIINTLKSIINCNLFLFLPNPQLTPIRTQSEANV